MDIVEVRFEKHPQPVNIASFVIRDLRNGREWSDTVRLDDWCWGSPAAREALSAYGFWLDLKKFVGSDRPALACNDTALLREYFKQFAAFKPREAWPFAT